MDFHCVFFREGPFLVGQLLEWDLCVQGGTIGELVHEIQLLLASQLTLNRELLDVSLPPKAPDLYWRRYKEGKELIYFWDIAYPILKEYDVQFFFRTYGIYP